MHRHEIALIRCTVLANPAFKQPPKLGEQPELVS